MKRRQFLWTVMAALVLSGCALPPPLLPFLPPPPPPHRPPSGGAWEGIPERDDNGQPMVRPGFRP